MEIKWNRSESFREALKSSPANLLLWEIFFYVYEVSALHTISLNAAADQLFNSFLRDFFEMTIGEHYQLTLYM